MPARPARSPQPTPLEIATLAARFLPPIDLTGIGPDAAWHPEEVRKAISELSAGTPRKASPDYRYPEGWATPFEVIAAEAVARARMLLAAAEGKTRQPVLDYARAGREAAEALRRDHAREEETRRADFARLAAGLATVPLETVLRHALPRVCAHRIENAWTCLRDYLATSIDDYRARRGLPLLPVHFAREATRAQKAAAVDSGADAAPPACILLEHSPDYQVDAAEFPALVDGLRRHYSTKGAALRQRRTRKGR
jgi:hypothetical protein